MADNDHHREDEEYQYHVLYLPRGIERLEKIGETVTFGPNETLFAAGDIPTFCYVVRSGSVFAYEYTYTGDRRVYNIMEPGSVFLEECCLFDRPCPVNFQTMDKCELIRIDKCDLKRAFKHDIDVVMDICESLTVKFLSTMEYQRYIPKQDSEWKICKLLLIFIDHYGEQREDGTVVLKRKISHQMIADILGMNRVTVSRKMKDLREMGFFESIDGCLLFRDREALENHMQHIVAEE